MDKLLEYVLAASLPSPENGIIYWNKANDLVPLHDWPGEVSRLVSCFYTNHAHNFEPTNSAILRGVYKANWARNSLNLNVLIPILKIFDQLSINYRLIKGGAIILYLGQLGARRMGDLDILIKHSDRGAVCAIFWGQGFSPRYLGDRRGGLNEIWENRNGVVIDLHFLRSFDSYQHAFSGYESIAYLGHFTKLPTIESTILIAIHHGQLNHSRGDQAQAFWDIAMIYQKANLASLQTLAITNGQMNDLRKGIMKLNALGLSLKFNDDSNRIEMFLGILRNRRRKLFHNIMPSSFPRIWNGKNTSLSALREAICTRHEVLYSIWALFGMLRPIERFIALKSGGLLPKVSLTFRESCSIQLSPKTWYSKDLNLTVRSYFVNEFRIQLMTPSISNSKLDIELEIDNFWPRMLFIDGKGYGHMTENLGKKYGFQVNTPSDRVELSFRDFSQNPQPWVGILRIRWSPGIPD